MSYLAQILALLAAPALAAPVCVPPAAFQAKIYNCGQNGIAARYALACRNALVKGAQQRGNDLAVLMKSLSIGHAQDKNMADATRRLRLAVASLEDERELLQDNTDILASYPDAMIDIPGSTQAGTSLDCFNVAFDDLQKIVGSLDDEIIRNQAAQTQAEALLATLGQSTGNLQNNASIQSAAAPAPLAAPAPVVKGRAPASGSDVTGLQEDRQKQQKK